MAKSITKLSDLAIMNLWNSCFNRSLCRLGGD